MGSIYQDQIISFAVPAKYDVQRVHEGHCSLSFKDVLITIIAGLEPAQTSVRRMEGNSKYLTGFSEVREVVFGTNVFRYQEARECIRGSRPRVEITMARSTEPSCWIRITAAHDVKISEFEELLSSISIKAQPSEKKTTEKPTTRASKGSSKSKPLQIARMKKVASVIIFADNYQFCLYDTAIEPFSQFPEIGDEKLRQGFTRTASAIWYFTRAHGNSHRMEMFVSDVYVDDKKAERVLAHNLTLKKGECAILDHEDETTIKLQPGTYTVYQRVYNLGTEDEEADESSILARDDLERYEIVIVPGAVDDEGVIRMGKTKV